MITITSAHDGRKYAVSGSAVKKIVEAGANWNGIRCYVKLDDGTTIEASETLGEIVGMIEKESSQ